MTYQEEAEKLTKKLREVIDKSSFSAHSVSYALRELDSFYGQAAENYARDAKICDVMASRSGT